MLRLLGQGETPQVGEVKRYVHVGVASKMEGSHYHMGAREPARHVGWPLVALDQPASGLPATEEPAPVPQPIPSFLGYVSVIF